MTLDQNPLMNGEGKPLIAVHAEHVMRYNEAGRVIAAMPDLYQAGKSGDDALVSSIRADLLESKIVSGTATHYVRGENFQGEILHYFGSEVIRPVVTLLAIPHYSYAQLDDVLDDARGKVYLRTLFNTTDSPDEMKAVLQRLSGKPSSETRVWTPGQDWRREGPGRAVILYILYGELNILSGHNNVCGRSRAIIGAPAGAARATEVIRKTNHL